MEWGVHGGVLLHGASGQLAGEGRTGSGPAALGAALAPRHWANPAAQDPFGPGPPGPESARPESGPGLIAPAA